MVVGRRTLVLRGSRPFARVLPWPVESLPRELPRRLGGRRQFLWTQCWDSPKFSCWCSDSKSSSGDDLDEIEFFGRTLYRDLLDLADAAHEVLVVKHVWFERSGLFGPQRIPER